MCGPFAISESISFNVLFSNRHGRAGNHSGVSSENNSGEARRQASTLIQYLNPPSRPKAQDNMSSWLHTERQSGEQSHSRTSLSKRGIRSLSLRTRYSFPKRLRRFRGPYHIATYKDSLRHYLEFGSLHHSSIHLISQTRHTTILPTTAKSESKYTKEINPQYAKNDTPSNDCKIDVGSAFNMTDLLEHYFTAAIVIVLFLNIEWCRPKTVYRLAKGLRLCGRFVDVELRYLALCKLTTSSWRLVGRRWLLV